MLDTNMCIYFLKGNQYIAEKLQLYSPKDIAIPAIVRAELYYGAEKSQARDRNLERLGAFLLPFRTVSFDENGANHYAQIRSALEKKGKPIGPSDLIIAATALAFRSTLVTNNTKEFERISELKIDDWSC